MTIANRARLLFLVVAVLAFATDQYSKSAVRAALEARNLRPFTIIPGYLDIIHSYNTGGAFGLFAGMPALFLYVPILIIVVLLLFLFRGGSLNLPVAVGLALQLGGAAGNLLDRIRTGKVFDFIECHLRNGWSWPTFNAADSFIVIGAFLFAWGILRDGGEGEKNSETMDARGE